MLNKKLLSVVAALSVFASSGAHAFSWEDRATVEHAFEQGSQTVMLTVPGRCEPAVSPLLESDCPTVQIKRQVPIYLIQARYNGQVFKTLSLMKPGETIPVRISADQNRADDEVKFAYTEAARLPQIFQAMGK